jgi:hypothetical protein
MARKWKIVIGVVVAFVVVVCVAALIVGTLSIGGRFHAMGWPSMDRGRIVDEGEDGAPDWGEGRFPGGDTFGRGRFVGGPLRGRFSGFGPGRHTSFWGRVFGLFSVVRGLFDLALVAAVIVLGIALYRQRRKVHAATPSPSSPTSE